MPSRSDVLDELLALTQAYKADDARRRLPMLEAAQMAAQPAGDAVAMPKTPQAGPELDEFAYLGTPSPPVGGTPGMPTMTRPPPDVPEIPASRSHGGSVVSGVLQSLREFYEHPGNVYQGKADPKDPAQAFNAATTIMSGGLGGVAAKAGEIALGSGPIRPIRAYHGSPHDYAPERLVRRPDGSTGYLTGAADRLPDVPPGYEVLKDFPLGRVRLDKIGTGEGAQAYGHGWYAAGNEGVARSYRDALGPQGSFDALDTFLRTNSRRGLNSQSVKAYLEANPRLAPLANDPKAVNALRDLLPTYNPKGAATGTELQHYRYLNDAVEKAVPGRMYEVAIHADQDRFLDWDKPLKEQSEYVRGTLNDPAKLGLEPRQGLNREGGAYAGWFDPATNKGIGGLNLRRHADTPPELPTRLLSDTEVGRALYTAGGSLKPAEATDLLRRADIPGIKYLDQGSRAAGDGSRNYVLFDDKIVEILRKYGVGSIAALPPAVQMAIQMGRDPEEAAAEPSSGTARASQLIQLMQSYMRGREPPPQPVPMGIRG